MERYQYGPAIGGRNIRVLVLHPAPNLTDELYGDLELHHLGVLRWDQPEYEPVSYAWGLHDFLHRLRIGQCFLPITSVVDTMLRHLRLSNEPRRLWIDALCMNQQDNDEKAAQVQAMAMIYRRRPVIVWLGAEEHQDDGETGQCTLQLIAGTHPMPKASDFLKDPSNCSALTAFLCRGWFHRRWVLQEIAFSEGGSVMCGSHKVPLDDLMIQLQLIRHHDPDHRWPILEPLRKVFQINFKHFGRRLVAEDSTPIAGDAPVSRNLLKLLDYFHEYECKDDLDRVYALSGLALMVDTTIDGVNTKRVDTRKATSMDVDYRETAPVLYCRVAEALIKGASPVSRDILHYAAAHRQDSDIEGSKRDIPSWVPDWRQHRRCWPVLGAGNAGGIFRLDESTIEIHGADPANVSLPRLRIKGVIYSSIRSVHPKHELFNRIELTKPSDRRWNDNDQRRTAARSRSRGMLHRDADRGQNVLIEIEEVQETFFPFEIAGALTMGLGRGAAARPDNLYISKSIDTVLRGRVVCLTSMATMALAPDDAEVGDFVAVFPGFNTPFILRRLAAEGANEEALGQTDQYHLVGDAWVNGIMMGEASESRYNKWITLL